MEKHQAQNAEEVAKIVGLSNQNPSAKGPVVIEVSLWDNRKVTAAYYHEKAKWNSPDAETDEEIFPDITEIKPLVMNLLENSVSFVTMTGAHNKVCSLEWTIS